MIIIKKLNWTEVVDNEDPKPSGKIKLEEYELVNKEKVSNSISEIKQKKLFFISTIRLISQFVWSNCSRGLYIKNKIINYLKTFTAIKRINFI